MRMIKIIFAGKYHLAKRIRLKIIVENFYLMVIGNAGGSIQQLCGYDKWFFDMQMNEYFYNYKCK